MKWFARHRVFTTVAALFLLLIIIIALSYLMKEQDNAVGSVSRTVVTAVQRPFLTLSDFLEEQKIRLTPEDSLIAENEALENKVDSLEKQLTISRLDREELSELRGLQNALSMGRLAESYSLAAGNVISFEGSNVFNIFTIDIGTESGVYRNSVVVNGDGLVGRVLSCGNGWARVVAAIDENSNIGFQVHAEKDYLGVCHGDGSGILVGSLLDENGVAQVGGTVVTSGNGGVYPAGIVLGKITKTELTGNDPLLSVTIEPAVYFKGLKKVAVLVLGQNAVPAK
jgi:rod shape-determining protein MreC